MSAAVSPSNHIECRGKLSYQTREKASKARSALKRFSQNIYHCCGCGGFHLGRPKPSQKGRL